MSSRSTSRSTPTAGSRREAIRAYVPTGAVSSVDDLLGIRLNVDQKDLFVEQLRSSSGEPSRLWEGLRQAGFDDDLITALQTDGKLGFLTRQNAPLVRQLVERQGVRDTRDLVTAGLYDAEAWAPHVAGRVPEGLTAEVYAEGLAAQVRLAHPTLVTADLVRREAIDVGGPNIATAVADFLVANDDEHRIGQTPLRTWTGFDDLDAEQQQGALLVERLHQLTPSDASMRALSNLGIGSAMAVSKYSETEFLAAHGDAFPSLEEARLTYRKSQSVHATTLNLVTGYITQSNLPAIHVLSGGGDGIESVPLPADIPASATLETLFNNLDFCACEHCKSVLSPAAYFVELLEFLDLTDVPHDGANPIDVLFARRPDLQHLLLSCENTNVALPYIDLVNEILEHYVVNGDLDDFHGHDTAPGIASIDLLADPQFVEAAAYTTLADRVFPAPLPFDMPLAALRLQFEAWGTTLADALDVFGPPADARRERLGLNAAESSILTDSGFAALPEYFGEPAGASIDALNGAVANAKVFSRRVGVTYLELDRILKTRFVNPGVELVPLLVALHVGLDVIQSWLDGDTSDGELLDALPDDLDTAPYGDDVLAWLTANEALLMSLIVLAPTAEADPEIDDCDMGLRELRLARPVPGSNALTELEYHRLHRFIRLWRALERAMDADIETTDALVKTFLPIAAADLTPANLDATLATTLDRLANFVGVLAAEGVAKKRRDAWLELFDPALDATARAERMARLLKLGATDFANLTAISGIDPFADDLGTDAPSMPAFLRAWRLVDDSPLKIDDVDFVLRDGDPAGTRIPTAAQVRADVAQLRAVLAAVDATTGTPPDADLTLAHTRMALVYDTAVVDRFFSLLAGSTTYRAPLATVEEDLPAPITAVSAAIGFDAFADEVTFTGAMPTGVRDDLLAAAGALTLDDVDVIDAQPALDAYVDDLKAAITALHAGAAADLASLQADYPTLGAVLDAALDAPDPAAQAAVILDGILPAAAGATQGDGVARRAGDDVAHRRADGGGAHVGSGRAARRRQRRSRACSPTSWRSKRRSCSTATACTRWSSIRRRPTTTCCTCRRRPVPRSRSSSTGLRRSRPVPWAPSGEVAAAAAVPFVAGTPVPVVLTVAGLPADGVVTLRWRTDGVAKSAIPTSRLIDGAAADAAGASLLRLRKAVLLAGELPLTPRELIFFASTCPDTSGILDDLPVNGPPPAPDVPAIWEKLAALLTFVAIKRETEPDVDTWVAVLDNAALGDPAGQEQVATIGLWRPADVADAVTFLGAGR